jgi:hypothetical protein
MVNDRTRIAPTCRVGLSGSLESYIIQVDGSLTNQVSRIFVFDYNLPIKCLVLFRGDLGIDVMKNLGPRERFPVLQVV